MNKHAKRRPAGHGKIKPSRVRYIKLGRAGLWERECLAEGIIRIGFGTGRPEMFQLSSNSDWKGVAAAFRADGKTASMATRFTNELEVFFEDPGTVLWISFMNDSLHWGMVQDPAPQMHDDGDGVWRALRIGWRNTDLLGTTLSKDRLSGALTKLALFRGTSCDVDVSDYVIRRVNGQRVPEVERGLTALQEVNASALDLIRLLTPKDFELLVDLVFTTSGWRRVGVVGKTQSTLDLDLVLPSTGERAFVQVKSRTTSKELADYVAKLGDRADLYTRMFYVYHSGSPAMADHPGVTLWGPEKIAELVVDAGLVRWLIEKVS